MNGEKKRLKEFFSKNIHILIDQLSKVTKQSKLILWENIAIYIFWLYETVLHKIRGRRNTESSKEKIFIISFLKLLKALFGNDHDKSDKKILS